MPKLSRREAEVARLVADGLTNRQIAERLFVSERTAEFHVEQIRNKLGFHSRREIAGWLEDQGGSQQPPPNRLPVQLSSFVGRTRELHAVGSLLSQTRLVTITGAGGTGKTRLALEVATRALGDFPDGAWFVDLQALKDPGLVAPEAAAALAVTDIERELQDSRRLIVLDNCEQVAGSCRDLAVRLLTACPALKVLATSREPLGVAGEGVWALRPLIAAESVELFLERARLAAPDADLTLAQPGLIRALCEELDGIPLAIELAASHARVMSLSDIRARLQHRFSLLVGGGSASARQRTMEATVAWSYDLLAGTEQLLFRRLGVFAGAFFLDSAQGVAGDSALPADLVAEVLDRLVDRSLLVADRVADEPTRYRLLGTMRDFARERLGDDRALNSLRARHAAHFTSLAAVAGSELQGPKQATWMERIDAELDEFRAAFEWMLQSDPDSALVIAAELDWFWGMRGRVSEGRRALAAALAKARTPTVMRGRALIGSGWLARLQNDLEAGLAFHAESVEVLRQFDDPVQLGQALVWHAEAAASLNDWKTARQGWENVIDLVAPLGATDPMSYALLELSLAELIDHRPGGARDYARRALAMTAELSNARGNALCHMVISFAAHLDGNLEEARAEIRDCLVALRATGALADLGWPLRIAAIETAAAGSQATAVVLAGAAQALSAATGRTDDMAFIEEKLGPTLEVARAELGEAAYLEAWNRGLSMDASTAVDLVLSAAVPAPLA